MAMGLSAGILFLAVAGNLSLLHNDESSPGAQKAFCAVGTEASSPCGWDMILTTHFHVVPRLRIPDSYLHCTTKIKGKGIPVKC
jgi:hypothetical protein